MAQADVNNILEGLRQHAQKVQAAGQLALEQSRLDAEKEQKKKELEFQQKQIDATNKLAQGHLDLAKKAVDIAAQTHASQLEQQYQQTGNLPPGSKVEPNDTGGGGGVGFLGAGTQATGQTVAPQPDNGNQSTQGLYSDITLPVTDSNNNPIKLSQVANPTVFAQQQVDRQRVLNAPAEETKTRELLASKEQDEERLKESKAADFSRFMMQKMYDDQRRKEQDDAAFAREKYKAANDLTIAKLKLAGDQTDLSPYISQAQNGELTTEGIKKLPIKPVEQMKIMNGVIQPGGRVINDATQQTLKDMATISTAIPNLDSALATLKDNPILARTPGTQAYKDYNEALHQVELVLPQVGRIIAGDKGRMSNQQIKYAEGAFLPSRNPIGTDIKTNIKNRNDFVNTMNDVIKSHLAGMTPEHQALLKENFGVKPLTPFGISPGLDNQQQGQQPQGLSPAAIELMKKHGIQ